MRYDDLLFVIIFVLKIIESQPYVNTTFSKVEVCFKQTVVFVYFNSKNTRKYT